MKFSESQSSYIRLIFNNALLWSKIRYIKDVTGLEKIQQLHNPSAGALLRKGLHPSCWKETQSQSLQVLKQCRNATCFLTLSFLHNIVIVVPPYFVPASQQFLQSPLNPSLSSIYPTCHKAGEDQSKSKEERVVCRSLEALKGTSQHLDDSECGRQLG